MSDEAITPTPEATVEAPETTEAPVEPSQDSEYEAKLQQLEEEKTQITEERDNLKIALGESREKRKAMKEEVKAEPTPAPSQEALRAMVDEITNEKMNTLRTDIAVSSFDKIMGELTTHPKEVELMKHHYRNSIKPSGIDEASIRKDLLLAKAAANLEHLQFGNQPKFDSRLSSAMSMSGGKDSGSQSKPEVDLTNEDKKMLSAFGVDPTKAAQKIAEERTR